MAPKTPSTAAAAAAATASLAAGYLLWRRQAVLSENGDQRTPLSGEDLAHHCFPHHGSNRILRMNNGSFGACPSEVIHACEGHRRAWLEHPDDHWNKELGPGLAAAAADVARRVAHCEPEELALVDNLTVAASVVADWLVQDCLAHAMPVAGERDHGRTLERKAVLLQSSSTCKFHGTKERFLPTFAPPFPEPPHV